MREIYNTLYSTWNGKKSRTQTFSETGGVSAEGGGGRRVMKEMKRKEKMKEDGKDEGRNDIKNIPRIANAVDMSSVTINCQVRMNV